LIVGAGGVGAPAALYLAASGIGTLGILDSDIVDASNLQRQVLHRADRVGMPKARSARETLLALNPGICVDALECRLVSHNAETFFADYDLVIDGSDNFATRYLVNDAAILTGKPVVHGSVGKFEGQVTVIDPQRGPCYRCLFPEPPPLDPASCCSKEGVLSVLPGVVGLLVAVEAIKLILGLGEPLVGGLLTYDALAARFHRVNTRRDPACRYCGGRTAFPCLVDRT
jgi:molybdopterin/thiamine biosynthesis adenylyltransferase